MNAEISAREASDRHSRGSRLIDVRERDEWDEAHVDGAILIPVDDVPARLAEIPRTGEVILMCRSGRRSALVQDALERLHGYTNLVNLDGGILAWQKAGLPVVAKRGP